VSILYTSWKLHSRPYVYLAVDWLVSWGLTALSAHIGHIVP